MSASSPFQRIFDHCVTLFPFMMTDHMKVFHATTLINQWLAGGCDAEADIIPTITTLWSKSVQKITSLNYFNKAVLAARDARVGTVEHLEKLEMMRAKTIQIKRRTGVYVSESDEAWLKQREQDKLPAPTTIK
jgi:hypothetical protein